MCLCTDHLRRVVGAGVRQRTGVQICQSNSFPAFQATERRLPVFCGHIASTSSSRTAISFLHIEDNDLNACVLKGLAAHRLPMHVPMLDQRGFLGSEAGDNLTLFVTLLLSSGQLDDLLSQVLCLPDSVKQQPLLGLLEVSVVAGFEGSGAGRKGRGLWRSSS